MQGTAGSAGGSAVLNITEPPVIISNLIPGLTYEFKVRTCISSRLTIHIAQWYIYLGSGLFLEPHVFVLACLLAFC